MRENLEEMSQQGRSLAVMLGSAALTRRYVEEDCVKVYAAGRVAYARDAFDGLGLMDKIVNNNFDAHLEEVRRKNEGRPVNQSRKLGRAADPRPLRRSTPRRSGCGGLNSPATWRSPSRPSGVRARSRGSRRKPSCPISTSACSTNPVGYPKDGKSLAQHCEWAK